MMKNNGWWLLAVVSMLTVAACSGSNDSDCAEMGTCDSGRRCTSHADCSDGLFCSGVESCDPASSSADARGCVDGPPPCPGIACNETNDDCTLDCSDVDSDGVLPVPCGGADCDDDDAGRFPGNLEVCDSNDVDEDCNPATFGARDGDGDGSVDHLCCNEAPGGLRNCGGDCDDAEGDANPAATETCDTIDNDCDDDIDENVTSECWTDFDNDGYALLDATVLEICGDCGTGRTGRNPLSTDGADCDDMASGVHPGAREICDGIDNDCSSGTAAAPDEDADGDQHSPTGSSCEVTPTSYPKDDCRDTNADVHPGQTEYFLEPTCPVADRCNCVDGSLGCVHPLLLCDCDGPSDPPIGQQSWNWDYDCSASADREPAASCTLCAIAPPYCGRPGPVITAGNPGCGAPVDRIDTCGECPCGPGPQHSSLRGCR